jgi:hypothetical protein
MLAPFCCRIWVRIQIFFDIFAWILSLSVFDFVHVPVLPPSLGCYIYACLRRLSTTSPVVFLFCFEFEFALSLNFSESGFVFIVGLWDSGILAF